MSKKTREELFSSNDREKSGRLAFNFDDPVVMNKLVSVMRTLHRDGVRGGDTTSALVNIVDASKFDANLSKGEGNLLFKCLNTMSKTGVSMNEITCESKFYYDYFLGEYSSQKDKKNLRLRNGCCTAEKCPIKLFYEILANNGKLTTKHKELFSIGSSRTRVQQEVTSPVQQMGETTTETHPRSKLPSTNCQVCGKTDNLKMCSKCKSVKYCSAECQKHDWPQHKINCTNK